ncbi:MAG: murein hydrolase activator EnvC family protein, partial [Acetobacteraceae bacterium]
PFRSYGKLMILSCGGNIDVVLAGFATLHVHAGQRVRRGDPVGAMPDWQPGSSAPRPTLYVEVRRHGDPVDPGKLLKAG